MTVPLEAGFERWLAPLAPKSALRWMCSRTSIHPIGRYPPESVLRQLLQGGCSTASRAARTRCKRCARIFVDDFMRPHGVLQPICLFGVWRQRSQRLGKFGGRPRARYSQQGWGPIWPICIWTGVIVQCTQSVFGLMRLPNN